MQFSTSWDDGYALDLRMANLLERHGCTGTFYVCPMKQHGVEMLRRDQIRSLSEHHRIGAHSMTHPRLARLPLDQAREEIRASKRWVEEITGKPCTTFCYPYGDVNPAVRNLTQEAGFTEARTTRELEFIAPDPLLQPVTLQVTPFPLRKRFRPVWKVLDPIGPLRSRFVRLQRLGTPLTAMTSWLALAKHLYRYAAETHQPYFHLYGHSREVERYAMWGELEKFLRFICERDNRI